MESAIQTMMPQLSHRRFRGADVPDNRWRGISARLNAAVNRSACSERTRAGDGRAIPATSPPVAAPPIPQRPECV